MLNENNDLILCDSVLESEERKKLAAIRIASWYKKVIDKRRQKEFLKICTSVKMMSSKSIRQKKDEIRRKCAYKVLDIIKRIAQCHKIEKSVLQFSHHVKIIQK